MTEHRGIPVRNIFCMLAYAFQELRQETYRSVATEDFKNAAELFAEILRLGVGKLLRHGLRRDYVAVEETLPTLRGRLSLSATLRERIARRQRLACEYDEFLVDNTYNRIVKAALLTLLHTAAVSTGRKDALRRQLRYFGDVGKVELRRVRWDTLRYDRNSRLYQMLHFICRMLADDRLLTTDEGDNILPQFAIQDINRLFEKFVLEFYRRHLPQCKASDRWIMWNKREPQPVSFLPQMHTDITLTLGHRTLIIDTKFYSHNLQDHMGQKTIHSANLYQIFTYVVNADRDHTGLVDGMLLYARTADEQQPSGGFTWADGNRLSFRTLDLNRPFADITAQLVTIAEQWREAHSDIPQLCWKHLL